MPWPEAVSAYSSKCWATAERVIVIAADTRRTDTPRRLGRAQGGLYQLAPSLPLPVASVRLTVALTVALHRLPAPLQPLRGEFAVLLSSLEAEPLRCCAPLQSASATLSPSASGCTPLPSCTVATLQRSHSARRFSGFGRITRSAGSGSPSASFAALPFDSSRLTR